MSNRSKSAALSATPSATEAAEAPKVANVANVANAAKGAAPTPAAEAAQGVPFRTPRELADALGVALTPPLTPKQVQRLRKPLPGYAATLGDAAELIEHDADALGFHDGEAAQLRDLQARYKVLRTNETVVETVYTSIYHQRLQLDDEAMGLLQRIARRVVSRAEENPQLPLRWSILLDFLGAFRKGGRPLAVVENPAPTGDGEV